MTKELRQKSKNLENETSFYDKIKNFFRYFQRGLVAKNRLRRESAPLNNTHGIKGRKH